ncbi:hypothetical protein LQW54_006142 [Pestalotiopsis sp. IQ-011]
MYIKFHLAALGVILMEGLVFGAPMASDSTTRGPLQKYPFTRRDLSVLTLHQELGPLLSNISTILGPDSPEWTNATTRFNIYSRPDVQAVVVPGKESDVAKIVTYCNDNSIDFLAYNRGHGLPTTLQIFQGLQINLGQLTGISIAEDGTSALVQGGVDNGQVLEAVWDQGYVTTTGTATCVGVMGPGLGGGHGVYEGQYGLVMDNFLHLNVVLANGSAIGVNETSYPDLWWGMRGAGHNFGIVTSAQMKLYPREIESWFYKNFWWTGDKLETVFGALNELHAKDNGTTPPKMGFEAVLISMNETVSKTEDQATLYWSFAYAGPAEDAEELLAPFNAIEAVGTKGGSTSLPNLSNAMTAAGEGGSCYPQRFVGASTLTGQYNITAQRRIYDLFNRKVAEYPELAAVSSMYNEGYATKGMEDIPKELSAYPHRDSKHIIYFLSAIPDEDESDLKAVAEEWAKETWDLWLEGEDVGSRPTTYVNYAFGHDYETQASIYGDEAWRLEKLRELKAEYDPNNRFRYYNPIVY